MFNFVGLISKVGGTNLVAKIIILSW